MNQSAVELRIDRDGDGDIDITIGEIRGVPGKMLVSINNHSVDSHTYGSEDSEAPWRELTATGKTVRVRGVFALRDGVTAKPQIREGGQLDARVWLRRWGKAIHSNAWKVQRFKPIRESDGTSNKHEIWLETVEDAAVVDGH